MIGGLRGLVKGSYNDGMPIEAQNPAETEREQSLESRVDEGIEQALAIVKARYEDSPNPDDVLEFHNRAHTNDVVRRAHVILEMIADSDPQSVSERDLQRGRIAAAFHDVWQEYDITPDPDLDGSRTRVIRKKRSGSNETKSADEAISFMRESNEREGAVFTNDDEVVVREAIMATVADYDPELRTAYQKNLRPESGVVAHALALADLAGAGMDGPDQFFKEGAAFFREDNMDVSRAMRALRGGEPMSDDDKAYYGERMRAWFALQVDFARGRRDRFMKELEGLPAAASQRLSEALFARFDSSIEAAEKRAEDVQGMSFEDRARLMGYELPAA